MECWWGSIIIKVIIKNVYALSNSMPYEIPFIMWITTVRGFRSAASVPALYVNMSFMETRTKPPQQIVFDSNSVIFLTDQSSQLNTETSLFLKYIFDVLIVCTRNKLLNNFMFGQFQYQLCNSAAMPCDNVPTRRERGLAGSCSEFQYTYQSITIVD